MGEQAANDIVHDDLTGCIMPVARARRRDMLMTSGAFMVILDLAS